MITDFLIKVAKGFDFLWAGVLEFYELANLTPKKKVMALVFGSIAISVVIGYPQLLWLLALAPVAFIQNMFFTLVSRSRNSQDTDYHRFCAWGSNGVWFICQVMIVKNIWTAIMAGQWWYAILAGIVYSLATTEGSVLMMKRLIATEKGKRRVGANDKIDKLEDRLQVLERMIILSNRVRTEAVSGADAISKLAPLTYRPLNTIYRHGKNIK